ncbi:efflux RND transporter permease subunit [Anaerolentibacter hominis]|uniref:efflux RND transporter permease subunit n=1 Tax=Anaerolentibacter hominis TaxID=3079009 RepID=UPI0031B84AEB
MLSRFSVKKPYTVVVAVVLILILGFVSFTNMTTDLLPSMNLPYAVVMTTYPGASPEEVEEQVTKPIESSMATVSNIQEISSVSNENYSLVILEFAQSTNMDSVSLEMRESLDQIEGFWDDAVGSPIIMKLNPDMLPIMVAAVDADGMSRAELTRLVENDLSQELESIEGVASVSASGNIDENIQVIIRQEKIDEMNDQLKKGLDKKFAEAQEKIDEADQEIEDGKKELTNGRKELEDGKKKAFDEIAKGQTQLESSQMEVVKGELTLDKQEAELKAQEEQVDSALEQLTPIAEALAAAPEQLRMAKEGMAGIENALAGIDQLIAAGQSTPELLAQKQALEEQKTVLEGQIAALENIDASVKTKLIEAGLAEAGDSRSASDIVEEQMTSLNTAKASITKGKKAIKEAREKIESGKSDVASALAELSKNGALTSIQISTGLAKLDLADQQLATGQKELDSAKDELEKSKEDAYDQMSLDNIITTDMVKGILSAQNFSMPAGTVTEDNVDIMVRVGNKLADEKDLADLVLLDPVSMGIEDMEPIRVSDVADVLMTDNADEVYAKINGNPGLILTMEKQTGYSTGDVSERVNDKIQELMEKDDSLHITVLMDQGIYIDMVVNSVLQNLVFGGILAILILFLFLRDIKPTLIIACSIPISLLSAVVLMYFSGVTLNIISLSGLALGVGMLVDNSIVVIENIYRMRNDGVPIKKAAIEGASQVGGAIMASTLTTVSVFLPIVFTTGLTRQLFVDMGLTIAYSLLASLIVAMTLVPAMAAGMLTKEKVRKSGAMDRVKEFVGRMIALALRHKVIVILGSLILLAVSAFCAVSRGTSMMPEMESTQVTVTVSMEDADLQELGAMSDTVIERLSDLSDIEAIGAMAGGGGMMGMGSGSGSSVTMYLILSEDKTLTNNELVEEIENRTGDLNCDIKTNTQMMDMSALGSKGLAIQIKGRDLDKLQMIAKDLAVKVGEVKGTAGVSDGIDETTDELRVVVDKEKASAYNLTVAQVFQLINAKLAEETKATTIATDVTDYDVIISDSEVEKMTRKDIREMTIPVTNADGEKEEIELADIVDFVDTASMNSIKRDNQSRYITVTASIDKGYNVGLVGSEVEKAIREYDLPEGYTAEMAGEDTTINDAMVQVFKMLALALAFMYLIMVAQFQSLLSPFIIMFTIPLAFTGGLFGLFFTGSEVSVVAMIGFVMLSGIIVNNGIVLVDYINQLRRDGMSKAEAIVEAGKTRLRPIVMTALTTILGLSTMAAGFGMGADMTQPMAVVTIGGLLYGTLLTLFVVPCIYDLFHREKPVRTEELQEL